MGCVPSSESAARDDSKPHASQDSRSRPYAVDAPVLDSPVHAPAIHDHAVVKNASPVKTTVVHAISAAPESPPTPEPVRMGSQLMGSQHMGSTHMSSQHMASQNMSSQHMGSQHMSSQNMASQHMSSQQMGSTHMSSQHMGSQQMSSQHIGSQQMSSQHLGSQHMSSQHMGSQHSVPRQPQFAAPMAPPIQASRPSQPTATPAPVAAEEEKDHDSDWDQCSTQFDLGEGEGGPNAPAQATPAANAGKSQSSLLLQYQPEEPPMEFTETAVLRIDRLRGCTFINQYLVVKFLGRGACGKVFLCLNTNDLRLYAMKVVKKMDLEATATNNKKRQRSPVEDLKREIAIMKTMNHPNIVTLSEVIDDPKGNKLLLVMEYMDGGPVLTREALEKRDCLPEPLCRQYFRDMLKSLDYLHAHKVVHGDLKPENVLMSGNGEVKLSDFGCSKVFVTGNEYLDRCNGTPAFLAPEMMKPHTRYRGRPSDVYALGACLYTLVYGRIPFTAPNLLKLFQVVQNDPVRYHEDVPISKQLRDLMEGMLCKEPSRRLTLQDAMNHPWVTMHGRFPIKPFRELQEGETQDMHDGVVGHETFTEANPTVDLMKRFAMMGEQDEVFNPGEYLIKQGEQGSFALYIVSGVVDILVRTPSQRSPGNDEAMDGKEDEKMSEYAAQLRSLADRAAEKANELITNLQNRAGPDKRYLLVAQRGAGDLVGEMAMLNKDGARCATVRCASRVVVRIIRMEAMLDYVREQPHVRHQLRELLWRRNNESTMVEALYRLAQVREDPPAAMK